MLLLIANIFCYTMNRIVTLMVYKKRRRKNVFTSPVVGETEGDKSFFPIEKLCDIPKIPCNSRRVRKAKAIIYQPNR